jgi:hypothetical protein
VVRARHAAAHPGTRAATARRLIDGLVRDIASLSKVDVSRSCSSAAGTTR